MLKVLAALCIATVVNCVIYDGPCPLMESDNYKNFSCFNVIKGSNRFKVLALLPTSNESVNLFHNPLGNIDDIEIDFMCSNLIDVIRNEAETVKFFMTCNSTTKDLEKYSAGCNYKSINMTSKGWEVVKYDSCTPANFWNSVNIVSYMNQLYAVLWGCRNLLNGKHEQGAWILGNKNNFTVAAKLLDKLLTVDLKFSKSSTKDYILFNQTYSGKVAPCSTKVCEYNLLCKNDVQYSEEVE